MSIFKHTPKETVKTTVTVVTEKPEETSKKAFDEVAPKEIGKLDMVIAFDTTGSMAAYIGAVRQEVADLIPKLFKDNPDLRLGIMESACEDEEMKEVYHKYRKEREEFNS